VKVTSITATPAVSVFGVGGGDGAFDSSAIGQATRAAMNDAVTETTAIFKQAVPAAPAPQ